MRAPGWVSMGQSGTDTLPVGGRDHLPPPPTGSVSEPLSRPVLESTFVWVEDRGRVHSLSLLP
jgi:hypothetical protein